MCHFITLITPAADREAVRAVLERHGRSAEAVDNPSVRKVLREGEQQFLTTPGHCDCGTVLAPRHDTPEAFEVAIAKDVARWRRKGWSPAKIARAIEDVRKADARPRGGGGDSLELWTAVLNDLGDTLKLPHAGLLLRFYGGNVATEAFVATRREAPRRLSRAEALSAIVQDEVTIFPLR